MLVIIKMFSRCRKNIRECFERLMNLITLSRATQTGIAELIREGVVCEIVLQIMMIMFIVLYISTMFLSLIDIIIGLIK